MVNFVCIVFEEGVKMLTLSSMENIIVECNLKASLRKLPLVAFRFQFRKLLILAGNYPSFSFSHSLLSGIDAPSF